MNATNFLKSSRPATWATLVLIAGAAFVGLQALVVVGQYIHAGTVWYKAGGFNPPLITVGQSATIEFLVASAIMLAFLIGLVKSSSPSRTRSLAKWLTGLLCANLVLWLALVISTATQIVAR